MNKRKVYTVVPNKGGWRLTGPDILRCDYGNKAELVAYARETAIVNQPSQLRIKGRNGCLQTEHTYPRSSDPRKSRG